MATTDRSLWGSLANLLAFVGLVAIGIALLIGRLFPGNGISGAFLLIGQLIAYAIVAFYALRYALGNRRSTGALVAFLLVWAAAVVIIVLFTFWGL